MHHTHLPCLGDKQMRGLCPATQQPGRSPGWPHHDPNSGETVMADGGVPLLSADLRALYSSRPKTPDVRPDASSARRRDAGRTVRGSSA